MTQSAQQSPAPQALRQGYEDPGVNNRGMLIFLFFFTLMGVVITTGVWVLDKYYLKQPRAIDLQTSVAPQTQSFPAPNLQPTQQHNKFPHEDLAELRKEKQAIFHQLGWKMDPSTDLPVIPQSIIDQLAAQQAQKGGPR